MKRFLLGCTALVLLAGAAHAADLPTKAPILKAPPVVTYDWTGFYLGAFYSSSITGTKAHTDPPFTGGALPGVVDRTTGGMGFGGTLGYNWQFAPTWLVGVEGEFGTLGIDRTMPDWFDPVLVGTKTDWYSTVRGRFGYVAGPSLLYVTGGAAFVNITDTFGGAGGGAAPLPAVANTTTKTGWVVGGGIETKLSRNWSATAEYLYIDAGSTTFLSDPFSIPGAPTTFDHTYHVLKTGLNYKLDGNWEGLPFFGAPLLASNHQWGGFYAGVNVGGGISLVRANAGPTPQGETGIDGTGFAGGGQVGYNYMLGKMWLGTWFVGVEGDIGYLGVRGRVSEWNDTVSNFQADTHWYATARGRIGTTTGPALLYFTGGAAWVNLTDGFAPTPFLAGDASTRTASGWTLGGGTEVALDPRWSARFETLYIDVGHQIHDDLSLVGLPTVRAADFKDRFMVVRAGLNYQFGN